ncbi:MAG: DUF86 domain-containing protein [Sulfuricurvum sp.]|jgi:uncharacterized protein with HEPN domain|uniref:HepT-like ribonuclease domain-containing protein n=1 Tax=Sulfuricurvum sp. TaxID=2025608 RepID=UPI0025DE9C01|nr:DUF86 domain-containing protein [Sulfuricurvum sp.]MCK9372652.1 DUF86 domain-containing protein [Sulfuricurvum sp.]
MSKRGELLFLQDILDSTEAIFEFTNGLSVDEFSANRLVYSATIREFEIIGEATIHLSDETLSKYDQIVWRDLKDFRNILIHEYFGVDSQIVYNTIKNDLPLLKNVVQKMIEDYS